MIIVETCPECGHDLQDLIVATYPPIPKKQCCNCGWSWTGERGEIIKVPFAPSDNFNASGNYTFNIADLSVEILPQYKGDVNLTESINALIEALRDYI